MWYWGLSSDWLYARQAKNPTPTLQSLQPFYFDFGFFIFLDHPKKFSGTQVIPGGRAITQQIGYLP